MDGKESKHITTEGPGAVVPEWE